MDLLDAFFAAVVIFVITMIALVRRAKDSCHCKACRWERYKSDFGYGPGVPPQEGKK